MASMRDKTNRSSTPGSAAPSTEEVRRLIAVGKCKQAVELAKDLYKLAASAENQSLLVDAYISRIAQFQAKGAAEDAQVLLNLVHQRFPNYRQRLETLRNASAAASGDIAELLAPLALPNISEETRQSLELAIYGQLIDLPALADCPTLPAEHPLRLAAGAVNKVFALVTSAAVTDEQIALPQVSRHSPLSAWKMLIRAIAAFYRGETEACQHSLATIPPEAAVYRLVPVLRGVLEGKTSGTGAAAALQMRLGDQAVSLRKSLEQIDAAFAETNLRALNAAMRDASRISEMVSHEFHLRLLRQLAARCLFHDLPMAVGRPVWSKCPMNAEFWRTIAATEDARAPHLAPVFWHRFVVHAVAEGLFADKSMQVAVVYLHAAEGIIRGQPEIEQLRQLQKNAAATELLSMYYAGQPSEITALMPRDESAVIRKVLDPHWLFESAAAASPDEQTFEKWWAWGQQIKAPDKQQQHIATLWHRMLPKSARPLLLLAALAEDRNALAMALDFLQKAQALDAMNPQVRRARIRLLLATLWRHGKAKKPHLVSADIAELEGLPAMGEGDRASYIWVLRCLCCELEQDAHGKAQAVQKVAERFGPMTGRVLLESAATMAGLPLSTLWPLPDHSHPTDAQAVAQAHARASRLAHDIGLRVLIPETWFPLQFSLLSGKDCPLSNADVLLFGNMAVDQKDWPVGYVASTIGLARTTGAMAARFLLLRAHCLAAVSTGRTEQCLRAAMELAQQAHDVELAETLRIVANAGGHWRRISLAPLGEELLQQVLKAEREASVYPSRQAAADKSQVITQDVTHLFPRRPSVPTSSLYDDDLDDEDDEEEEEEDAYDDEFGGFGGGRFDDMPELKYFPKEALPILMRLLTKHGTTLDLDELTRRDPKALAELRNLLGQRAARTPKPGQRRQQKKERNR